MSTTAFSPTTDGQTERTNRTLEDMLRCYTDNNHRTWDLFLSAAEFCYNNTLHTAHGFTPFFLDLGYHPRDSHSQAFSELMFGSESMVPEDQSSANINYDEAAQEFYNDWNDTLSFAKAKLQEAAEHMQELMDSKRKPMSFAVGESVWLDVQDIYHYRMRVER